MTKKEYMGELKGRLRRLPKEDYDRAVEYFEEYLMEAGEENEAQAIEDLGTPEMAAAQIIRDFANEYAEKPKENVKKSFSGVWVAVLAVIAAPIGLPLALLAVALGVSFAAVIVALLVAVFMVAVAAVASSVPCILVSLWMLFTAPASGLATLGMGLIGAAIGIWVVWGSIALCRGFLHLMTKWFGKIAGGKKHEKK